MLSKGEQPSTGEKYVAKKDPALKMEDVDIEKLSFFGQQRIDDKKHVVKHGKANNLRLRNEQPNDLFDANSRQE